MGAAREERRGRGRRKGGEALSSLPLLAWLKHLHACLTQEVSKKERMREEKEEINKRYSGYQESRTKRKIKFSGEERQEETKVKAERKP